MPILKTPDEMAEDTQRIMAGDEPLPPDESANAVEDVPEAFNEWVDDNAGRTARARLLPYFIADNPQYVQMNLGKYQSHKTGSHMMRRSSDREFSLLLANPGINTPAVVPPTVAEDANTFCKLIGIERRELTWSEADGSSPNRDRFDDNCQSAVVVYEARRRGINVVSLGHSNDKNSISYRLGENGGIAFLDKKGKSVSPLKLPTDKKRMEAAIRKITEQNGRYHLGMNFNARYGHIIVAEKIKGHGVVFYDPSDGTTFSLGEIINMSQSIEILRVDNLVFNHDVLKAICKPY